MHIEYSPFFSRTKHSSPHTHTTTRNLFSTLCMGKSQNRRSRTPMHMYVREIQDPLREIESSTGDQRRQGPRQRNPPPDPTRTGFPQETATTIITAAAMAAMAAATVVLTTAKTTMTTTMTTGVNDPFSESSDGAGNGGEGGSSDPSLLQASSSSGPSAAAKAAAGTTDGHEAAVAAPAAAAHPAPPFRTPASAGVVGTTTKTGILRTRLPPPPPAGAVASVVMSPSEMGASEEVVRGYLTHHTPAFEEPSRVARALREMQDEIRRLPTPDREAHDRAVWLMGPQRKQQQQQQRGGGRGGGQSSPSSSVHDVLGRLKLQCLRAELWDGRLAARRLCRHLTLLHEHYGDVALRRELHFADLGKEEARLVRKGGVQLLPTRDRSGRRVVAFVGGWGEGFSVQTHVGATALWQPAGFGRHAKNSICRLTVYSCVPFLWSLTFCLPCCLYLFAIVFRSRYPCI